MKGVYQFIGYVSRQLFGSFIHSHSIYLIWDGLQGDGADHLPVFLTAMQKKSIYKILDPSHGRCSKKSQGSIDEMFFSSESAAVMIYDY